MQETGSVDTPHVMKLRVNDRVLSLLALLCESDTRQLADQAELRRLARQLRRARKYTVTSEENTP